MIHPANVFMYLSMSFLHNVSIKSSIRMDRWSGGLWCNRKATLRISLEVPMHQLFAQFGCNCTTAIYIYCWCWTRGLNILRVWFFIFSVTFELLTELLHRLMDDHLSLYDWQVVQLDATTSTRPFNHVSIIHISISHIHWIILTTTLYRDTESCRSLFV